MEQAQFNLHFHFNNVFAKKLGILAQTVHFGNSIADLHGNFVIRGGRGAGILAGRGNAGAGRRIGRGAGIGAGRGNAGAGAGAGAIGHTLGAGTTALGIQEHELDTGGRGRLGTGLIPHPHFLSNRNAYGEKKNRKK